MNRTTKRKILFVDDETPWRDTVRASLARAGFDVLAVPNASEAMLQAEDPALGLIIVDKDLAGESGVMLSKYLRWNHPDVPTMIYASPEHEADTTLHTRNQRADQCLPKGSMEELIAHVGHYIR
jgi:DNA-binding response OmpR family regulator